MEKKISLPPAKYILLAAVGVVVLLAAGYFVVTKMSGAPNASAGSGATATDGSVPSPVAQPLLQPPYYAQQQYAPASREVLPIGAAYGDGTYSTQYGPLTLQQIQNQGIYAQVWPNGGGPAPFYNTAVSLPIGAAYPNGTYSTPWGAMTLQQIQAQGLTSQVWPNGGGPTSPTAALPIGAIYPNGTYSTPMGPMTPAQIAAWGNAQGSSGGLVAQIQMMQNRAALPVTTGQLPIGSMYPNGTYSTPYGPLSMQQIDQRGIYLQVWPHGGPV